jgi:hypothetical protein
VLHEPLDDDLSLALIEAAVTVELEGHAIDFAPTSWGTKGEDITMDRVCPALGGWEIGPLPIFGHDLFPQLHIMHGGKSCFPTLMPCWNERESSRPSSSRNSNNSQMPNLVVSHISESVPVLVKPRRLNSSFRNTLYYALLSTTGTSLSFFLTF